MSPPPPGPCWGTTTCNSKGWQSSRWPTTSTAAGLLVITPPYPSSPVLYSPLLEVSPASTTQSRATYQPPSTKLPLKESASRWWRSRIHIPFPMIDIDTWKEKFGCFSEDASQFLEEFTNLKMPYEPTLGDLQALLSTCCIVEKKPDPWYSSGICQWIGRLKSGTYNLLYWRRWNPRPRPPLGIPTWR